MPNYLKGANTTQVIYFQPIKLILKVQEAKFEPTAS